MKYILPVWRRLFPIRYIPARKEIHASDKVRERDFLTSDFFPSIERILQQRMNDRKEEIIAKAGTKDAELAKARMEEIDTILRVWNNILEELNADSK